MTHKEMSEIFAVMLLAYPNAEVFKGGIAKLGPKDIRVLQLRRFQVRISPLLPSLPMTTLL